MVTNREPRPYPWRAYFGTMAGLSAIFVAVAFACEVVAKSEEPQVRKDGCVATDENRPTASVSEQEFRLLFK